VAKPPSGVQPIIVDVGPDTTDEELDKMAVALVAALDKQAEAQKK
jgi:hypothetical protein